MPFGVIDETQTAVAHDEVPAARRDDDAADCRRNRVAVLRAGHAPAGLPVQPIREGGAKGFIDVQDDQDREPECLRQAA